MVGNPPANAKRHRVLPDWGVQMPRATGPAEPLRTASAESVPQRKTLHAASMT